MDKATYIQIKNQISFEKKAWIAIAISLLDIGLVALAFSIIDNGIFSFVLSQIILALFYFHNFALLHEAGHGNISNKRWLNDAVGFYASLFAFLPYYPWKYIHQEHHIWTGNIDKDPTMAKLKKVREQKHVPWTFEFAWKSWLPLAAFAQQGVFWTYPMVLLKKGEMSAKVFYQSVFSVVWMISVYAALYYFFPSFINLENIVLSYIFYMVLTELINLPHHTQMPTFHTSPARNKLMAWEQHITTRSCDYGWLSSPLALNFNYHVEHHYYPSVPWYRLPTVRKVLKPVLDKEYTELRGIGWNLTNRAKLAKDIVLPEVTHPLLQSSIDHQ